MLWIIWSSWYGQNKTGYFWEAAFFFIENWKMLKHSKKRVENAIGPKRLKGTKSQKTQKITKISMDSKGSADKECWRVDKNY